MKPVFLLTTKILATALAVLCSFAAHASDNPGNTRIETLKKAFANPPKEYRSAPLWVWNTKVTRADIDRMLGDFKAQGFGGAFVHPRPGLITEYLGTEWFDLYKYSVEVGKKLGLDIWIYDENSYPTGFAGGHVPAQMPESYNQGQGLALTKAERIPDDVANYYLCLKKEGDTFLDITASIGEYKGILGDYYLYAKTFYGRSAWHGGYSYVDLLVPGVTEKFIDVTMSGYEKTFGKELGPVVKGVFSDEPNIESPGGIRWTPDLFAIFQKQWGYDLKAVMPLLVEQTGDWKHVRHNYLQTLTQLFIDRWAKPMNAYCEKKNLIWTGHYWEHGWPEMAHGGDNMAMYAWHQMPAIDMLFNQFNDVNPQAQFGSVRAVKELRSVANQMGRERTLSETYGGGGWDETFKDFKRLGDWEYVLGVNFMNQHLSHMTIVGARKYDYPPVFTPLSPWWVDYKALNDYFARLSLLMSRGEQMNDILVLEPTTTAWLYYTYAGDNAKTLAFGIDFQRFVTTLEKRQVEYDLGSENIIKDHGRIAKGRFVVGKRAYGTVVLPPQTENLDRATFRLLKEFVKGGGKLVAFSTPDRIDGREDRAWADFAQENVARIVSYSELSDEALADFLQNDRVDFHDLAGNDLYHQRRSYADGELLFLVNSSMTESAKGVVSLAGKSLAEMDAMTGAMHTYPCKVDGKNVRAEFMLPPAGSLVLFAASSPKKYGPAKPELASGKVLQAVATVEVNRLRDNVLMLDFCDLSVDGESEKQLYTVEACSRLYGHFGMSDPWNSAIQYRQQVVERDTLRSGDIRVRYSFIVAGNVPTEGLRLVAEQPGLWKVKVNGRDLAALEGEEWLDTQFGVYDIAGVVRQGVNVVELSVKPMSIYAEIAPVYVLGNFALESAPAGWIVTEPVREFVLGSWKEQGQPFYSWDFSYGKTYRIDDLTARYALRLGSWNGTLAQVFVNGEKVGIVFAEPGMFDLTPYLKQGDNRIEVRVIGSLANLFGPHYSGDVGIAGPWHWNGVQKQAAGCDYRLRDYGLEADFEVLTSK